MVCDCIWSKLCIKRTGKMYVGVLIYSGILRLNPQKENLILSIMKYLLNKN